MHFTITWDNPQHTTLLVTYEDQWSWDDIRQSTEIFTKYLDENEHQVDVIVQMPPGNWMPPGSITSSYPQLIKSMGHPRTGLLVIVVSSKLLEIFAGILRQANRQYAHRILITSSLKKARARLERSDV